MVQSSKSAGFCKEASMVHEGHRQRLRDRFLQEGLDGFAPHEVLELLLCYAIPQRNVNPLAHELLAHFGSLHGVFEAAPEDLEQIEGIGPYAAAFLHMMAPLSRRIELSRMGQKPRLQNRRDAQAYCVNLLSGLQHEHFYLLALDAQMFLTGTALIGQGSLSEVPAYPRLAVEAAIKSGAHSVILCHNHPGGSTEPSQADLQATSRLAEVLSGIDVMVADHIIVAGGQAASLVQMGFLSHITQTDLPLHSV
jgi:DNA repair protein RadC